MDPRYSRPFTVEKKGLSGATEIRSSGGFLVAYVFPTKGYDISSEMSNQVKPTATSLKLARLLVRCANEDFKKKEKKKKFYGLHEGDVHYVDFDKSAKPLCGVNSVNISERTELITCLECKKTKKFKNASKEKGKRSEE